MRPIYCLSCLSISIIYYIADLPVTRLRLLTNKSDRIADRSFAALIHRLVRFQLTLPLANIIAQLFELRLFRRFYEARGMPD